MNTSNTKTTCRSLLDSLGACDQAIECYGNMPLTEAWAICDRGDWMLWLAAQMVGKDGWPTKKDIVLATCDCAELALPSFEKKHPNDDRPRKAIETVRAWVRYEATIEQVRYASYAAACSTGYPMYTSAYIAADAVKYAAAFAASYATAYAAGYGSNYASDTAYVVCQYNVNYPEVYDEAKKARREVLKQCAEICRARLFVPKGE